MASQYFTIDPDGTVRASVALEIKNYKVSITAHNASGPSPTLVGQEIPVLMGVPYDLAYTPTPNLISPVAVDTVLGEVSSVGGKWWQLSDNENFYITPKLGDPTTGVITAKVIIGEDVSGFSVTSLNEIGSSTPLTGLDVTLGLGAPYGLSFQAVTLPPPTAPIPADFILGYASATNAESWTISPIGIEAYLKIESDGKVKSKVELQDGTYEFSIRAHNSSLIPSEELTGLEVEVLPAIITEVPINLAFAPELSLVDPVASGTEVGLATADGETNWLISDNDNFLIDEFGVATAKVDLTENTYTFTLTATNAGGSSAPLTGQSVTVAAPPIPVPINLAFASELSLVDPVASGTEVGLATADGETNWLISDNTNFLIDEFGVVTAKVDLTENTYTFTLTATNAGGSSAPLTGQSVTVAATPIPVPINLAFAPELALVDPVASGTEVGLATADGETNWLISDNTNFLIDEFGVVTAKVDLTENTYTFTLTATNAGGSSAPLTGQSVTVAATPIPVPINLAFAPELALVDPVASGTEVGLATADGETNWLISDNTNFLIDEFGVVTAKVDLTENTYTFTLTATNSSGSSDPLTDQQVVVGAPVPAFVSVWRLDSAHQQISLPLMAGAGTNYDFYVDWGDADDPGLVHVTYLSMSGSYHTYADSELEHTVTITGTIEGWAFSNSVDARKLIEIQNWGPLKFGNVVTGIFYGCENLTITATDAPDLTGITSTTAMFSLCSSLTNVPGMGSWDVSSITMMDSMFYGCTSFDPDLSGWDISSVTTMSSMFYGCTLSTANYDALLIAWGQEAVQSAVDLGAGNSKYTPATAIYNYTSSSTRALHERVADNFTVTESVTGVAVGVTWSVYWTDPLPTETQTMTWEAIIHSDDGGVPGTVVATSAPITESLTAENSTQENPFLSVAYITETLPPGNYWMEAHLISDVPDISQQGRLGVAANYGEGDSLRYMGSWQSPGWAESLMFYLKNGAAEIARDHLTGVKGWTITDGGPVV